MLVPRALRGHHAATAAAPPTGPEAIFEASKQVDLFDLDTGGPYEAGIAMLPECAEVRAWNDEARALAEPIIDAGGAGDAAGARQVNALCEQMNDWVYDTAKAWLGQGKLVGVVGGDHHPLEPGACVPPFQEIPRVHHLRRPRRARAHRRPARRAGHRDGVPHPGPDPARRPRRPRPLRQGPHRLGQDDRVRHPDDRPGRPGRAPPPQGPRARADPRAGLAGPRRARPCWPVPAAASSRRSTAATASASSSTPCAAASTSPWPAPAA